MTTSGKTSDREYQRVTTKDNEWYNEWQRVTTNDNKWQRVTASGKKWQRVTASGKTNENCTIHIEESIIVIFLWQKQMHYFKGWMAATRVVKWTDCL